MWVFVCKMHCICWEYYIDFLLRWLDWKTLFNFSIPHVQNTLIHELIFEWKSDSSLEFIAHKVGSERKIISKYIIYYKYILSEWPRFLSKTEYIYILRFIYPSSVTIRTNATHGQMMMFSPARRSCLPDFLHTKYTPETTARKIFVRSTWTTHTKNRTRTTRK